jgi:hypothetical protein
MKKLKPMVTLLVILLIVAAFLGAVTVIYFQHNFGNSDGNYKVGDHTSNFTESTATTSTQTQIQMSVSNPRIHYETFNYSSGTVTFPASENFTIGISSKVETNIHLIAQNVPFGQWVAFLPDNFVNVGESEAQSTMIVAGGISPLQETALNNTIEVEAQSSNGVVAYSNFVTTPTQNISVIDGSATSSLTFPQIWTVDPNGSWFQVFGAVYDPEMSGLQNSTKVSLSINGYSNDGGTANPLPPWLEIYFPRPTFLLNADAPSYFLVAAKTFSAPPGTYSISVNENISNMMFTDSFELVVQAPIRA